MAYDPTNWKDRVVERPMTFNIVNNPDGTVTLTPAPGQILEAGTPVNAVNLNKLEQGLKTHEADIVQHGIIYGDDGHSYTACINNGNLTITDNITSTPSTQSLLLCDEYYLYMKAGIGNPDKVLKIDKSNYEVVGEFNTALNSGARHMVLDENYLYIATGNFIHKIDLVSFLEVGVTTRYSFTIDKIQIDDNYIYCGALAGSSTDYMKYNKNTLALVATANRIASSDVVSVDVDDNYFYAADRNYRILRKFDKVNLDLVASGNMPSTNIAQVISSGDYLYYLIDNVFKYDKSTLMQVTKANFQPYQGIVQGNSLYAVGSKGIVELDLADLSVITKGDIEETYKNIAISGKYIYVTPTTGVANKLIEKVYGIKYLRRI